jgi:hypothetical protein
MDRFNALGRGMQIMLVAGVLLLIDTFLSWQSVEVGPFEVSQNAWHGAGGVLLGLLTIVLVAWLVVRLAAVEIPLPVSSTLIAAFLGVLIFIIALLKNLVDDYSTFWSYVGVVLAALIAVGAWMQVQATGGMESLKGDLPSMPASQSAPPPAASEPPASAPPPPAPSAPPPPMSEPSPPESAPGSERPPERDT